MWDSVQRQDMQTKFDKIRHNKIRLNDDVENKTLLDVGYSVFILILEAS